MVKTLRDLIGRVLAIGFALALPHTASAQAVETLVVRGHRQSLHLYGHPGAPPIILASGDGGWLHLAPRLADALAVTGYYVIGFDSKAYLSSFTSGATTVRSTEVPGDFRALIDRAALQSIEKPILVGVSEGAGLAVLAATDLATQRSIGGVVVIGLPDLNELGWRWQDSLIYLTKGVPNEPTFSVATILAQVAPVPLAAIYSTRDEYVPRAEIERLMAAAQAPKRLWLIDAADHRFSNNFAECDRRVREALAWARSHGPS